MVLRSARGRPLRGLPTRDLLGRDAGLAGRGPRSVPRRPPHAALDGAGGPAGARGLPRPQLPRPGRDLRPRGRGTPVPARRRPAGHRRRRVGGRRGGCRATGPSPRGVPRRRLQPPRRRAERGEAGHHPVGADHQLGALPPRRPRHPSRERRPRPRLGHRPHPRRGRHVPGARGQRPGAVRRQLRHRQPPGDDQRLPRGLRHAADPSGPRLPAHPALRAASGGPGRRRRPDRRRAHPRRLQQRLLRAHPARPDDGRRAGRGARPRLLRRRRQDADDPGRATDRRHLPADRRRVPRPGALPPATRCSA